MYSFTWIFELGMQNEVGAFFCESVETIVMLNAFDDFKTTYLDWIKYSRAINMVFHSN
jgi:hypothetical protein